MGRLFFRIARASCIGVVLAVVVLAFVISPARTSGKSMLPTIQDGAIVLLYKIPHTLGTMPSYGDIVAVDGRIARPRTIADDLGDIYDNARMGTPYSNIDFWVKRVIGLPGDLIEIKEGKLYRNGKNVEELYILEPMKRENPRRYTVPEGTVFVMGDNRNISVDSREIGVVPIDHILGKVIFDFLSQ